MQTDCLGLEALPTSRAELVADEPGFSGRLCAFAPVSGLRLRRKRLPPCCRCGDAFDHWSPIFWQNNRRTREQDRIEAIFELRLCSADPNHSTAAAGRFAGGSASRARAARLSSIACYVSAALVRWVLYTHTTCVLCDTRQPKLTCVPVPITCRQIQRAKRDVSSAVFVNDDSASGGEVFRLEQQPPDRAAGRIHVCIRYSR